MAPKKKPTGAKAKSKAPEEEDSESDFVEEDSDESRDSDEYFPSETAMDRELEELRSRTKRRTAATPTQRALATRWNASEPVRRGRSRAIPVPSPQPARPSRSRTSTSAPPNPSKRKRTRGKRAKDESPEPEPEPKPEPVVSSPVSPTGKARSNDPELASLMFPGEDFEQAEDLFVMAVNESPKKKTTPTKTEAPTPAKKPVILDTEDDSEEELPGKRHRRRPVLLEEESEAVSAAQTPLTPPRSQAPDKDSASCVAAPPPAPSDSDSGSLPVSRRKRRRVVADSDEEDEGNEETLVDQPQPPPAALEGEEEVRRSPRKVEKKQRISIRGMSRLDSYKQSDDEEEEEVEEGSSEQTPDQDHEQAVSDDEEDSSPDSETDRRDRFKCICGSKELVYNYVGLDSPRCELCERFFHAVCVGLTETPKHWTCKACELDEGLGNQQANELELYDGVEYPLGKTEKEVADCLMRLAELDKSEVEPKGERAKVQAKLAKLLDKNVDLSALLPETPHAPLSHLICHAHDPLLTKLLSKKFDLDTTDLDNVPVIAGWLARLLETHDAQPAALERFSHLLNKLLDTRKDDRATRKLLRRWILFPASNEPHTILTLAASLPFTEPDLLRRCLAFLESQPPKKQAKILRHRWPLHAAASNLELRSLRIMLASPVFEDSMLLAKDRAGKTPLHYAVESSTAAPSDEAYDVVKELATRVAELPPPTASSKRFLENRHHIPDIFVKTFKNWSVPTKEGAVWDEKSGAYRVPGDIDLKKFAHWVDKDSREYRIRLRIEQERERVVRSIDIPDKEGMTPLHYACGADPEHDDECWAIDGVYLMGTDQKDAEPMSLRLARLFMSLGADPLAADNMGATALHFAAVSWYAPLVELLLETKGVEAGIVDFTGWTPLLYAHHGETVKEDMRKKGKLDAEGGAEVDGDCVVSLLKADPSQLKSLDVLLRSSLEGEPSLLEKTERHVVSEFLRSLATKPVCYHYLNDYLREHRDLIPTFAVFPGLLDFENRLYHLLENLGNIPRGWPQGMIVTHGQEFSSAFEYKRVLGSGSISVKFTNDMGYALGPLREFFKAVSIDMVKKENGIFQESDDGTYWFQPGSLSSAEEINKTEFAGALCANAILYQTNFGRVRLSLAVFKTIIGGKSLGLDDFEQIDSTLYRSWMKLLEAPLTGDEGFDFTISDEQGKALELVPGGENIAVTDENKEKYIELSCQWKLKRVAERRDAFARGFWSVLPKEYLTGCQPPEMQLVLFGLEKFDVDDWQKHTEFRGAPDDRFIANFWATVRAMKQDEMSLLLAFWTGTSGLPAGGFGSLKVLGGGTGLAVYVNVLAPTNHLPMASTCFNLLKIPLYKDLASLRDNLHVAIRYGSAGFEFT